MTSYGLPKCHRPARLLKYYGPGLPVYYAMLWSHAYMRSVGYRVFFGHGVATYRTCTLQVPCKVHVRVPRGPCGFHTGMGISVLSGLQEP